MPKFRLYFLYLLFISTFSLAQSGSYYVIIGVFTSEENAQKFADHTHSLELPALYGFSKERNVYYVYVRNTNDKDQATLTAESFKAEGLKGAWVFQGQLVPTEVYA